MSKKNHSTHDKAKFLFHIANQLLKENKSVLFIDHEAQIHSLMNHYLLHYPISKKAILFASTEEKALATIQDDHLHLAIIIVDILTPEGIELQLIKEIKPDGDKFFKVIQNNSTVDRFYFTENNEAEKYAKTEALYNRLLDGKNETEVIILKTNTTNEESISQSL